MRECDDITSRFFEVVRWEKALDTGVAKGLSHGVLRRLSSPEGRVALYRLIRDGEYAIGAPRAALIPKDEGAGFRTVYINDDADRVLLSIANDLLFELTPEMVHESCKSYISGIGCGRVVREVSRRIVSTPVSSGGMVGWKGDLSKYFDSVAIEYIDGAFDAVESRYGRSALIDVLRRYYHDDEYVERDGRLAHRYMSLRQGCAVSSWLSDVILYHIDERLSSLDGFYVRYCDDMLFVGRDSERAMNVLVEELDRMGLRLNPSKVEALRADRWFHFLGYSIKGGMISLSPGRVRKFRRSVDRATRRSRSLVGATSRVNRLLYKGIGDYSWARQVLPIITSEHDICCLNGYVMDALRAASTGKRRIGGLGYDATGNDGCVVRGKGRNVLSNRQKVPHMTETFRSLGCMRKALLTSRAAYETLVRQM